MIVGHGTSNEIAKAVNLVVESKSPEYICLKLWEKTGGNFSENFICWVYGSAFKKVGKYSLQKRA